MAIDDGHRVTVATSSLCLFGACTLWSVIYDTIYAHQDLTDDKKFGIKSMAVLFEGRTKPLLSLLLVAMTVLLIGCGSHSGMSVVYYTVAVLGSAISGP